MKVAIRTILFAFYLLLLLAMGFATLAERLYSTELAHHIVYHTPWFVSLWGLVAILGFIYYLSSIKKNKQNLRSIALLILHISLIIILIGSFVTYRFGQQGIIHLRHNSIMQQMNVKIGSHYEVKHLPFALKLDSFYIIKDIDDTVIDYVSNVSFYSNEEPVLSKISLNNVASYDGYRFYQSDYDADLKGSTLSVNYDPYGIAITYLGYFLLFASFIGFLFTQKIAPWQLISTLALGASWCVYYFFYDASWRSIPVLRHPLLAVHVLIIIWAYALFLILSVQSLFALIRKMKDENLRPLLNLAIGMLAIGIFVGAIWANISWGSYWSWDPKETWALITLLVYAVPVHRHQMKILQNERAYQCYLLFAFFFILFTYFGVNYLLGGMHSYI